VTALVDDQESAAARVLDIHEVANV
jgi:hypothetical protein